MEGTTPESAAPEGTERSMSLATIEPAHGLSREQIQLIKDTIAKGCTDGELDLFVQTCNRLGLDPFARHIHLVRRWDQNLGREVASHQVSIDGFRLIAERTRAYRGQTRPEWCGYDGVWREVWLANEPPAAARVGVHREGFREPLYRVARYESYVQRSKNKHTGQWGPTRMWATMPDVMLAKCAEALALRAAFPNDLGGVYAAEEMDQATPAAPEEAPSFPLASMPAQQAPQEPEYSPPADVRPDAQVLPFRGGAQGPAEGVSGEVLSNWGPKLRACQSRDALVSWMRQVIACGFEPATKRQLFELWSRQVRACLPGQDPNVVLAEAKRGAK